MPRENGGHLAHAAPPHRNPIPIHAPLTRIGLACTVVDPRKVIGIVESNASDRVSAFTKPDAVSQAIGHHVADFLLKEIARGRIPQTFRPCRRGTAIWPTASWRRLEHP